MKTLSCICCSGRSFSTCCGPLLEGDQVAKTPKQLMCSRYSAYALGGYGEYLLQTWLPANSSGLSVADLSLNSTNWTSLNIVNHIQKGDQGWVEFRASYRDEDDKDLVHHEKSVFKRVQGRWFYIEGEVVSSLK
jgi:SEC-C motif-containing protein